MVAPTHMQVTPVVRFDPRGNVVKVVQYSYFLGANGPFVDEYPDDASGAAAIQSKIQERIQHLVAIGAL